MREVHKPEKIKQKRKIYFAKYLPKVGDVVRIEIPNPRCVFEAMVIGRMPFGIESAMAKKLPNEDVEIKEAIFGLGFAPSRYDAVIIHTITGWKIFEKDAHKAVIIKVEIIS